MKAAFQTFEEENLDRLKKDNPSLRLSQLKQLLKKEWMKSPSNPFNKPTKPFNDNLGATLNERHASEEDDD
jgi:glycerophosphoryl diester phosphodiesterase